MGKKRPTCHTLISARADCQRCAWSANTANSQALAAQHYDKKGHRVEVTIRTEIIYGRLSGAVRNVPNQGRLML